MCVKSREQGTKLALKGSEHSLAPYKKGNVLPASGRVLQDKSFVSFQIISGFQTLCTEIEAKWHLRTTDWTVNWRLKQLMWESVTGKHIWSRRKIPCSYPSLTFFQMLLEDKLAQQMRKENGVFQQQAAVPNSAQSDGGWKLLSNRWPMLNEIGISLPVSVK